MPFIGDLDRRIGDVPDNLQSLSKREFEILGELMLARTTKEIARRFDISPATVAIFRSRILLKLDARSTLEAVRLIADATLSGLIPVSGHMRAECPSPLQSAVIENFGPNQRGADHQNDHSRIQYTFPPRPKPNR